MKNNKLFQYILIGLVIISTSISVYALGAVNSKDVAYNSGNVATVQEALDTLYDSIDVVTITPVGAVLAYMGTTAPENYLICDGQVYNIGDYQKLADHIKNNFGSYNYFGGNGTTTFAVPDLRGEFLRGSGTNSRSGQGSGTTVGTHQDATTTLQTILHTTDKSNYNLHNYVSVNDTGAVTTHANVDSWIDTGVVQKDLVVKYTTVNTLTSNLGKYTSRPTNTSVNYIIKVK